MTTGQTHLEPIATRDLQLIDGAGSAARVRIEIYAPTVAEGGHSCRFRITGLTRRTIDESVAGVDAIQALHLCIQTIATWMEAGIQRTSKRLQWPPEGERFSNLELCRETLATRGPEMSSTPVAADGAMDRAIREAFALLRTDPRTAKVAFKRLKRDALGRALVLQAVECLQGELAAARATNDEDEALRVTRNIAHLQPSAENLAALAGELEERGKVHAARGLYMRAAAVVERGTKLDRMITERLSDMQPTRLERSRKNTKRRSGPAAR